MQTQITARHFDATPTLRSYAADSLGRLEKYYDGITDAHVILTSDGNVDSSNAEITLGVYRQRLSARHTARTHQEAIDHCVNRLRRQILKYKSKLKSTDRDAHR